MPRPLTDLTGQTYGRLTVLGPNPRKLSGKARWSCQCKCGQIRDVLGHNLRNGKTKSCGCKDHDNKTGARVDRTGVRRGSLVVLGRDPARPGENRWLAQCDCGRQAAFSVYEIKRRRRCGPGCGLSIAGKYAGVKCPVWARRLFGHHRSNAAQRGLTHTVPLDAFIRLIRMDCRYCGAPPSNLADREFRWSGLDRIDSDRGYEPGNVLPCCRQCNIAKSDTPPDVFRAWVLRLADRFQRGVV